MHILSFDAEIILYIYMASCIVVLVFNLLYMLMDRMQKKHANKERLTLVDSIADQIELIARTGKVEEKHVNSLTRKLKRVSQLKVFEQSLQKIWEETPEELCLEYVGQIRKVFLILTGIYEKRDEIEKAYLCSLIEEFSIEKERQGMDNILEYLLRRIIEKDAFLRENALKAIYSSGNKDAVLSAWIKLCENDIFHNEKLLSDGLLKFVGDKKELAQLLWDHRKEFHTYLLLPLMQFIRFTSGDFQQEFLEFLEKEDEDKELRLEVIRYLRRYPYEPAREVLQNFIRYQEYMDWEYGAMAASALSGYPGEDTVYCLKGGLSAINWYVRHNCAQSLIVDLHISQIELFDIYNGRDRYAREILNYITQKSKIDKQEMELDINYV